MNSIRLEQAKAHYKDAQKHGCRMVEQRILWSWEKLFEWVTEKSESTPRQKEIQKLWQQLGTIARTRASLNNIINEHRYSYLGKTATLQLFQATIVLDNLSKQLKQSMQPPAKLTQNPPLTG